MKVFLLGMFSLLLSSNVLAQENQFVANAFQGTRFVNEQSVNLVDHGELRLYIQHRFGEIDGGLYQLFGLDQATMRLGFEYGLGKNLNVGFGRSTYMKTYDVYATDRLFKRVMFPNFRLNIPDAFQSSRKNQVISGFNGESIELRNDVRFTFNNVAMFSFVVVPVKFILVVLPNRPVENTSLFQFFLVGSFNFYSHRFTFLQK